MEPQRAVGPLSSAKSCLAPVAVGHKEGALPGASSAVLRCGREEGASLFLLTLYIFSVFLRTLLDAA